MGMDYIRCIAQAVHRRSAALRRERRRKMGLSCKALSCTAFTWVPRVRLLPVAQKRGRWAAQGRAVPSLCGAGAEQEEAVPEPRWLPCPGVKAEGLSDFLKTS